MSSNNWQSKLLKTYLNFFMDLMYILYVFKWYNQIKCSLNLLLFVKLVYKKGFKNKSMPISSNIKIF